MQRRIGRLEQPRDRAGQGGGILGVDPVGPVDDRRGRHNRADTRMDQRGMDLVSLHMHLEPGAALVARHHGHARGLAHDHRLGPRKPLRDLGDHRRGAGAAHLFVKAHRQLQGPRHTLPLRLDQRPDRESHESLHVAGAAPVEPSVALGDGPGVRMPVLPVDRHHVAVTRQHDPARDLGPDMGIERGLVPLFVPEAVAGDPEPVQIVLDPVDQRQVCCRG